ncbi:MAG: PH domain-containing protein [Halapricum sp.]
MRPESEWFGPDALRALYRVYLLVALAGVLSIPVFVAIVQPDAPWYLLGVAFGVGAVVLGFGWWWTAAYERTVGYRLSDTEVDYRGGVWWHTRATVPYSRITNVEANQGPISRYFGVGNVAIQTAGMGAQSTAEITVRAIADYEELKDQLLTAVRGTPGDATGESRRTSPTVEGTNLDQLLAEVRAIREQLER